MRGAFFSTQIIMCAAKFAAHFRCYEVVFMVQ